MSTSPQRTDGIAGFLSLAGRATVQVAECVTSWRASVKAAEISYGSPRLVRIRADRLDCHDGGDPEQMMDAAAAAYVFV
jgi:hypothetical protein